MPLSITHAGLSLTAGSLTTLSPCVFPLLPLVAGGALQGHRLSPVALGLGMASSFALIGVALGAVGPALGIDSDHVRVFGAWLLIAFAVALLVPAWNTAFTRVLSPLADHAGAVASRFRGGSLASAFGLGAVLPLVAVAYASRAGFLRAKERVMAHIETIKRGFAALLGLMGIAILAGWDKALEARIVAWLPTSWVDLTVMF